jgi:hypothetical protein
VAGACQSPTIGTWKALFINDEWDGFYVDVARGRKGKKACQDEFIEIVSGVGSVRRVALVA